MGILDTLLQNVVVGTQQGQGSMLEVAWELLQQNGGLRGIMSKFEHGGMADHVSSWVATGANMPISGAQLQEILGSGSIGEIFFFSSRRRHTRLQGDWSSDVCSSD